MAVMMDRKFETLDTGINEFEYGVYMGGSELVKVFRTDDRDMASVVEGEARKFAQTLRLQDRTHTYEARRINVPRQLPDGGVVHN